MLSRMLGPLEVQAGGEWTRVSAPKWRALLAVLLLSPGEMVPTERLVDELWGDEPPSGARKLVSGYVLRLRRLIGDPAGQVLMTRAPGYQLVAGLADLDVSRFEQLVSAARTALNDAEAARAAELLAEAQAMWRGPALADVPRGPRIAAEAARLDELRVEALELRVETGIYGGRAAELVAELRQLTAGYPLRERFWHQLMRALELAGRPAEALEVYGQARKVLAEELGADPGPDLQQLHHRLLAAGPAPAARAAASRPAAAALRQLPAAVAHFTGRAAELATLAGLMDQASGRPGPLVISAITGTAGVGKTALAVHWAHQVAGKFPDGQLYVNLRGYDPGQPMAAAEALAGFLRALGVAGQDLPAGTEERAARYRSLLAGRRMLVLLDNAVHAEQVRPLLPGSPSCVVVVTSRDALAGLVARDGACRLDLGLLPHAEAVRLLRALIGRRADADPGAAATLAVRCARLPLALRLAAELAVASPGVTLAGLARELADEQRRLESLDAGGDPRTGMRAVFSWSVRHLDDEAARTFRLLGLHPGPDFDCCAVAALSGAALGSARRVLSRLARSCLIQQAGPERYGMHDLIRAYAAEQATGQDSEPERRAALTRLLDHYLAAAAAAAHAMFPADPDRPQIPAPASRMLPQPGPAAARVWLDAHRTVLVAVAGHAASHGWPGHAIGLATIFRYSDVGHFADAAAMHSNALRAATDTGDRAAQAAALTMLGGADTAQGRFQRAASHLQQALVLCRITGDRPGQAGALVNLASAAYCQGRYQQSAEHCRQAMALYRQAGIGSGEARVRLHLGMIDLRQGRHQQAAGHLRQSLALFREAGIRSGEARALRSLGELGLRQGCHEHATGHLRQSLALGRETGSRSCQAEALAGLGLAELRQCRHRQATGHLRQSLALYREDENHSGQSEAHNGLGETFLDSGQKEQARTQHADALALATRADDKYEQARAHAGLASACQATGDSEQAHSHWREALTLHTALGTPEAGQIQATIAAAAACSTSRPQPARSCQECRPRL